MKDHIEEDKEDAHCYVDVVLTNNAPVTVDCPPRDSDDEEKTLATMVTCAPMHRATCPDILTHTKSVNILSYSDDEKKILTTVVPCEPVIFPIRGTSDNLLKVYEMLIPALSLTGYDDVCVVSP